MDFVRANRGKPVYAADKIDEMSVRRT